MFGMHEEPGDTVATFKIKGKKVDFCLVNEGDALCLMADGFYVLGFKDDGTVYAYEDGANRHNKLDHDECGRLSLTFVTDPENEEEN